jgi:predicted PurR-regulated permease PerM
MAFPDRRTIDILLTILLFAIVLAVVYIARGVLVIFAFAILFAYLIDPIVQFLQRHSLFSRNLRGPHVVEAYVALLILIAIVSHEVAPGLLGRTAKVFKEIPALMDGISTGEIATEIGAKYGWTDAQELRLKSFLGQHRTEIQAILTATERFLSDAARALVLIPILAIFFLNNGADITNSLIQLVSTKDNIVGFQSLADELNVMLRHYIRAKVTLGALSFLYGSAAMLVLGYPHAIALGILAGTLEFVPIAGWMISAATIISLGALTHSHWIWMAALLGVWRMLMDYLIAPRVMGHELEMRPVLTVFTIMVGGAVGGIVGVYLALPFVATLRVLWRRLVLLRPQTGHPI